MPPRKKPSPSAEPEGFACGHCDRVFQREASLLKHMCAQKQRFIDKDEKHVKLGFTIFQMFHDLNYKSKTKRTFEQFAKSNFYMAFVKFAKYLLEINAVEPKEFIGFVLKNRVPIDDWTAAAVYELYLRELNKRETADRALERNFLLMERWAVDSGETWTDFFHKVPTPLAVTWIRSGRISPWVIYTASTAGALLTRMTPEQHELVKAALDPAFWERKLSENPDDVEAIRAVLEEAGV